MRVIHLITTIERGGAENQLLALAREQRLHDYDVQVWYIKGAAELAISFEEYGIPVTKLEIWRAIRTFRFLISQLYKRKRTLLHSHLPRAEILGVALNLVFGTQLVVSKHNTEPMWPNVYVGISKKLARIVARRAKTIVCISNAVESYLVKIGELEPSVDSLQTIHYGVPNRDGGPIRGVRNDIGPVELRVLVLARLEPQKDVSTVIRALGRLQGLAPFPKTRIFGSGSLRSSLEDEVQLSRMTEVISIEGKTDDPLKILGESDVLILPSRYEGFGLVLLEAMQTETMILAAKNDAATEVLRGNNKLLFSIGDDWELAHLLFRLILFSEDRVQNLSSVASLNHYYDIAKTFLNHDDLYKRTLGGDKR